MQICLGILAIQLLIGTAYGLHENTKMIGVDCEKYLVTRSRQNGDWRRADGSCCVKDIAVMPDGTLLAAKQKSLYTKRSPNMGEWTEVEDSCCVKDVAVMSDGTILGTTPEERLVKRTDLNSDWEFVQHGKSCVSIAVYPDGKILGVTKQGILKERDGVDGSWTRVGNGGKVVATDISIQPDGTVYGITDDEGVHILQEDNTWGPMLENSFCVQSIASPGNLKTK
ncbi:uncharacterized protein LOC144433395 [Glandiceps talaboti]